MPSHPGIESVVHAFAAFEKAIRPLEAHHALEDALDVASDVLDDVEAAFAHLHVRNIVQAWFNRVDEQLRLAMNDGKSSPEALRIGLANLSLFDDPLFEISPDRFDRDGFGDILLLQKKPFEKWSKQELNQWNSFASRFFRTHK